MKNRLRVKNIKTLPRLHGELQQNTLYFPDNKAVIEAMRIILIRHGESEGNINPSAYVEYGDPQVPLTEKGWRQAHRAGLFLPGYLEQNNLESPARIWVSPFRRTQETLSGLLEGMGPAFFPDQHNVRQDPNLAEQSFGHLAYSIDQKGLVNRMVGKALIAFSRAIHKDNPFQALTPLGEAPSSAYQHVGSFIDTLRRDREKHDINNIMIVTHGAVIKNFMMNRFHLPPDAWKQLNTPGNADIFVINKNDSGAWQVNRIFDGEAGTPVLENPIEGIERLHAGNLPPVPDFLKNHRP